MLTRKVYNDAQERAVRMIRQAGIRLTEEEHRKVAVHDYGFGRIEQEGLELLNLVVGERACLQVAVLFAGQTEPEHWHTSDGNEQGKEESIRVIHGTLYLFVPGEGQTDRVPRGRESVYKSRRELVLEAGQQGTIDAGERHWMQAGPEGVVMYRVTTLARDTVDKYSDSSVMRITRIVD